MAASLYPCIGFLLISDKICFLVLPIIPILLGINKSITDKNYITEKSDIVNGVRDKTDEQ